MPVGQNSDESPLLKKYAKLWAETKPLQFGTSNVEDGDYIAKLIGYDYGVSRKGLGRAQIKELWKIMEGEFDGEEIPVYIGLVDPNLSKEENQRSMGIYKARASVLGIPVSDDLEELPQIIEECKKTGEIFTFYDVTVQSNKGFTNVFIKNPNTQVQEVEETTEEGENVDQGEEGVESETETQEEQEEEQQIQKPKPAMAKTGQGKVSSVTKPAPSQKGGTVSKAGTRR
jgi:hypothetical protein